MKKLYEITKGMHEWQCRVEIDEEVELPQLSKGNAPYTTKDAMKNMVMFWVGGEQRLYLNDGDITKTFLQQLAREIYIILVEHNWNTNGVISSFEDREGWWVMDGSAGITIVFTDDLEIGHDEFFVEEVKND